jgi:hypothetical protein
MSWKRRGGIWNKFSCQSVIIIVFTQIRIIVLNYICYPTPSGALVPTLVGFAATHCVGSSCIVLVTRGFVAASCACVMLAALMTMNPAVVAWERRVGGPHGPRNSQRCHQEAGWFRLASASTSFLLAAVNVVIKEERAKFEAVNCWRTVVLLAAARTELLRAVPSWSMVATGAGVTAWALPNGPPTPDA